MTEKTEFKQVSSDELKAWALTRLTTEAPGVTASVIANAMGVNTLDLYAALFDLRKAGLIVRTLVGGNEDDEDDEEDTGTYHWRLRARLL